MREHFFLKTYLFESESMSGKEGQREKQTPTKQGAHHRAPSQEQTFNQLSHSGAPPKFCF